jgi:formylglycine-generating enzyme required for sulfatase activity
MTLDRLALDGLARALEPRGLSPRELAEVVWLAAQLAPPVVAEAGEAAEPDAPAEAAHPPDAAAEGAVEVGAALPSAGGSVEVGTPRRAPAASTVVEVRREPARALGWQRAMARLATWAAEGAPRIDAAATVAGSATRGGDPWPVWACAPVPTTALVVLEEPAGQLEPWRTEVEALLRAARRSGGFVSVDHRWLDASPKPIALRPGQSALVLLVTDGLREAPRGDALRAWLPRGRPSRLVWLNPWGPGGWHRTAVAPLGAAAPTVVPSRGAAGWTAALLPMDSRALAGLEGWAQGRGARGVRGVRLPRAAPRPGPALPALGSAERARQLAAAMAAPSRLALGLAAAVPGYVDVELLTGLGRTLGADKIGREHLTEALASGLFERVPERQREARDGDDAPPVVARFVDAEARRAALGWLTRSTAQAVILELVRLTKDGGRDLAHLALPVRLLWRATGEQEGDAAAGEELPEACQALLDAVTLSRMDVPAGVLEEIGRAARRGVEPGRVPVEVKGEEGLRVGVWVEGPQLRSLGEEIAASLRAEGVRATVRTHGLGEFGGFASRPWPEWLETELVEHDRLLVLGAVPVRKEPVSVVFNPAPWGVPNQDRSDPRRFRVVPVNTNGVAAPGGLYDLLAARWDGPASTPALLRRLGDGRLPGDRRTVELPGGVKLELAFIPAGTFWMGSPDGIGDDDERPRHQVTLTRPYWLGLTPVTQAQWAAVAATLPSLNASPSLFHGADRPVEQVSWDDARAWCNALSACLGLRPAYPTLTDPDAIDWSAGARLPTEAEWERACRAGTDSAWNFGDVEQSLDLHAWFRRNSHRETKQVGKFRPNRWGLYDFHGNVWEWCWDSAYRRYTSEPAVDPRLPPSASGARCARGGSFGYSAVRCRSAYRYNGGPAGRTQDLGIRVVVPAPATP